METLQIYDKEAGMRLDRFLKKRYPKLPIGLVFKLIRKRKVTLERKRAAPDTRLHLGQTVELFEDLSGFELPPDEHVRRAARRRESGHFRKNFKVIAEDDTIVVVNKPVGIVVHPGPQHHGGDTLLDLLKAHLPDAFTESSDYKPAFVHRLDRGTSGVLVAAKTREAANALETSFRTGLTHKTYLTIVKGVPSRAGGRIEFPLMRHRTLSGVSRWVAVKDRQKKRALAGKMQAASTRYEVRERFGKATLLEVEPETGRTHQIRVHLQAIGHPILGDGDYGDRVVNREFRASCGLEHVVLHARRIEFPHPVSGRHVSFKAPLPEDVERVLERLRRNAAKQKAERER